MPTVSTLPITQQRISSSLAKQGRTAAAAVFCTVAALLVLGYHPTAEDGGIYTAATTLRLQPDLFPLERGFAAAHTAHSLFVPLLALCVNLLHLPLAVVLLLAYATSVALTVWAAQYLIAYLFAERRVQHGALLLFAVSLGLPIAGTSLYLVDPYLTARSFSTPLLIAAMAYLLRRRNVLFAGSLTAAAALHPMMAACSLPLFGALLALRSERPVRNVCLLAATVCGAMVTVRWLGVPDSPALRDASLTRDYWFPERWAVYEMLGLLAPPIILHWLSRRRADNRLPYKARLLAESTALATLIVALPACCLIHRGGDSLLLARLQPLRLLHLVYCMFLPLLAGAIMSFQWRWMLLLRWAAAVIAGACLFGMQRQIYSHSDHFEVPGARPVNGYQQAFEWIRDNTPKNALFALDADYTTSPGEDAQVFRAIALRSSLPDAAKDGGISSVVPALAGEWAVASRAQHDLAKLMDAERLTRVRPLGATWIVLPASSATRFSCPFRNDWAQVCRLP